MDGPCVCCASVTLLKKIKNRRDIAHSECSGHGSAQGERLVHVSFDDGASGNSGVEEGQPFRVILSQPACPRRSSL